MITLIGLILTVSQPSDGVTPSGVTETQTSTVTDEEQLQLEAELRQALAAEGDSEPRSISPPSPAGSIRLIDVSFDLLVAGGGGTSSEEDLRWLQGGGHDPKNHGFTFQNGELTLAGIVDPYVRGDTHVVLQLDEAGETVVELEEAFLTTLSLPAHLQVKAGQFFTAFGRLNPVHPHAWQFVDQPVISSRLLGGDGLRGPGVQINWLTPLPLFFELVGAVSNGNGETAVSFRAPEGEELAGRVARARPVDGLDELLYAARALLSFDPSDEATIVFGLSGVFGPNSSSDNARTVLYGADLYVKWKPLDSDKGWPFLTWQTEVMGRRYGAGSVVVALDPTTDVNAVPFANVDDFGGYSQLVFGFERPFTVGVRYDHAEGSNVEFDLYDELGVDRSYSTGGDPMRARRDRLSLALSYFPTEFSKVRLQFNHDDTTALAGATADSVFLQAEIAFGAHGAHSF
ncbi:MAG: hypothetical protein HYV07_23930 [Deltaproteobacteria bacterium]|nr:hypothetical protein [Deltaproteobacteria bacterium]